MLLNCHTYHSLRYGTFSQKVLLELTQAAAYSNLTLTDINNTSVCLNFIRLAPKYGIKPVIGVDFWHSARQLYVALAKNNEGFRELNIFLSQHSHTKNELPL